MDTNSVEKSVPSSSHGDTSENHVEDVVAGLSGVVITHEDKQRYALDLLKNVCEDNLITNRDLGIDLEQDASLPDLNTSIAETTGVEASTSFEGDVIGSLENAELVGTPPVKVADQLIVAAASKTFENYTTSSLHKKITTGRKQVDAVAGQYFELYDELK